ncbi:MAG TPA: DUF378 domain-containing protein [Patescibacteria group bacterium]|nr:DUF378 domain-containing protein [Patescibacteria group bacterium]
MKMTTLDTVAVVLIVVGGLNWGLVGLFNFNLVSMLFGEMTLLTKLVYDVVGISALYLAVKMLTKGEK